MFPARRAPTVPQNPTTGARNASHRERQDRVPGRGALRARGPAAAGAEALEATRPPGWPLRRPHDRRRDRLRRRGRRRGKRPRPRADAGARGREAGRGRRPAAAARIGVTLKEFTVSPAPAAGRAGKVTFRVRNAGAVRHEFVVLRTTKAAADLLKGSEASEAGNVGEIGDVKPGATKTLRLDLKAGHYALICNLPGHYVAGQRADFVVK